jgi:hypothetical protein
MKNIYCVWYIRFLATFNLGQARYASKSFFLLQDILLILFLKPNIYFLCLFLYEWDFFHLVSPDTYYNALLGLYTYMKPVTRAPKNN